MNDGKEGESEGPAAPAGAPPEAPGTQPKAEPEEEAMAPPAAPAEPLAAKATAIMEMLLLVDAANGFNNLGKLSMLWTVRHRYPRLATYAFNCYRRFACL